MPMSVPPRTAAPSGRVDAVSRALPATGVLGKRAAGVVDVVAGRGGPLDDVAACGAPLAGRGGTLDVVTGGALAGRGDSLPTLVVAASVAFG